MPSNGTALARMPLFALEQADSEGLDREQLLSTAGFTEEELQDPDSRVRSSKNLALWQSIFEAVDDTDLGLRLGAAMSAQMAGLVGYAMMHSANLGEALQRLAKYGRILEENYPPEIKLTPNTIDYCVEPLPEQRVKLRRLADYDLAAVLVVVRQLTGLELEPLEIHFPYAEPAEDLSAHRNFFRGRLLFDQPKIKLVFKRDHAKLPIQAADENLGRYLEQHAEIVLAALAPGGSVTEKVERALWAEVKEGRPSLENVASALAVSPRTLQRRLSEEGTSFSQVLEDFRQEMATVLLEDDKLAVYEIAFLLGYSEPSTFHRAFRRWTNSSPREFRAAGSTSSSD